ncbi:Transmembrane protein 184C [Fasciola hepatica]|uniref:Transmembrane protein 184C n=1 Tax=Fasciola hepatica TaxID=6192 RepID=A0A4E0R5F1_FASHE|nr:Transmembrane protein 184C [Fasciola hepatica]
MNPVSKFICVKFVVFMSFWQSILIFILAVSGVFKDVKIWEMHDVKSIGIVLQNFAICIEMFFAALAHHFSFSHQPYVDPNAPQGNCCTSWWSMWDVSDMRRDVFEHVRHIGNTLRHLGKPGRRDSHRRHPVPNYHPTRVPLLSDSGGDDDEDYLRVESNPLLRQSNTEKSQSLLTAPPQVSLVDVVLSPSLSNTDPPEQTGAPSTPSPIAPHSNGDMRLGLSEQNLLQ